MTVHEHAAELINHIEGRNLKNKEWLNEANGEIRIAATYSTCPDYWAKFGVFTPADFDRSVALDELSDAYKEVHGIRPHWMSDLSMEEIQEQMNHLHKDAEAEAELEAELEKGLEQEFESEVAFMIENGANDRLAAIRWMLQGLGDKVSEYTSDYCVPDTHFILNQIGWPQSVAKEVHPLLLEM
jgi:hypothetical protein